MKRFMIFCLVGAALVAGAAQWTLTLTQSTRCIPSRTITLGEATAWTNNITVATGGYFSNESRVYMALGSGSSTNAPTHKTGTATGGDGIEWLGVPPFFGQNGVFAQVLEGSEAHFNRNTTASTNTPWMVMRTFNAGSSWYFAPTNSGTTTVTFMEL